MNQMPEESMPDQATPVERSATTGVREKASPSRPRIGRLPPYRVLLHNDDHNDRMYVVETIVDLTPLNIKHAATVMLEAHNTGTALLLVTHRERAELYVEQFQSRNLTVTIETAD